jgi:hypothetical protein
MFAISFASTAKGGPAQASPQPAGNNAEVECRALEVHTDAAKTVTVVVFHHASEKSRSALAELLRAHSGALVEVAAEGTQGNAWQGTVFRMKSCFGRGLLLLPATAALSKGAVFHLRLPQLRAGATPSGHE